MPAQMITTEDLYVFKLELLSEIKALLTNQGNLKPQKKWLKSEDIRKLLRVSPGTLQAMRVSKALPYTKIGGVIYYDYDDVEKMMRGSRK